MKHCLGTSPGCLAESRPANIFIGRIFRWIVIYQSLTRSKEASTLEVIHYQIIIRIKTIPPRTSSWGWVSQWSSSWRLSCWPGGGQWSADSWRSWPSSAAARPAPTSRTDPAAQSTCWSGSSPRVK